MIKKIILASLLIILLINCCYGLDDSTVEINNITFKIPENYRGGEQSDNGYSYENEFSISCIDDNIPRHIGLWACEKEYEENLEIDNHPVRYYYQYNNYVGNHSHAYFASDSSIYEISWVGNNITPTIESLIKNTPQSQINNDEFYNILDSSIETYKTDRINRLNADGEYNYIQSKINSQYPNNEKDDHMDEILITMLNK